jgi:MinD superfamily P-loop ATPase
VKEVTIISGKGGTGKTSIVASFAALAGGAVLADCDVDAADLHLVLAPTVRRSEEFSGGSQAWIDPERCTGCGRCQQLCRFDAIETDAATGLCRVDPIGCEGCGVCAWFCPADAVTFAPAVNGRWFVSDTRHGPMVHATLGIAEENSGKLVSTVRTEARRVAAEQDRPMVIVDGSPGIGCPVIASITGADLVLIVTEPTLSGLHDLQRVAQLAGHFQIPAMVCVNKWDLHPQVAEQIESEADSLQLRFAGRVRYDRAVTEAQLHQRSVVEHTSAGCTEDIRGLWQAVRDTLA